MQKFITLEGGEGSGKSTQAKMLAEYLESQGETVCLTHEPNAGGIRKLLLSAGEQWHSISETLLFLADRYEHIHSIILPALERGEWVICDRFSDSTIAYQGYGHELGESFVKNLSFAAYPEGVPVPSITFLLDIPAEEGVRRALSRRGDEERFEHMDIGFHEHVRIGFLSIAEQESDRCVVLDAEKSIAELHDTIVEIFNERF